MPIRLHHYKDSKKARAYRIRHKKKNYNSGGFIREKHDSTRRWTEAEVTIMGVLHDKGMTDREIAKVIERSIQAIQHKRVRMKEAITK